MYLVWRGAGILTPLFTALGAIAGLMVWSMTHMAKTYEGGFIGLGIALVGGGGLWLMAQREYERSGNVHYDAQNDRPVVTGQTSGHFWFIPTRAWAVILGMGGVILAVVTTL